MERRAAGGNGTVFKIGEFSKLTRVTVRMLRYYDEMGLLKPARVDPRTGYWMYSSGQIPILNKIIYLRDSGFNVAEISAAVGSRNQDSIIRQLDGKYEEIEKAIQAEREKLSKVELAKKEILRGENEMYCNVSIKTVPECRVLSLRKIIPDYYTEGEMWQELSAFVAGHRIPVSNDTFSVYHDEEYKEQDVDVEVCMPVKKTGEDAEGFTYRSVGSVSLMACTMVYGEFSNIAGAYISFAKWLQENSQYRMNGTNRQIVHRGPWNERDPQKYVVEIQIPLEKV